MTSERVPTAGDREATRPVDITRVVLRPIGTPLPLGFLALTLATSLLSALQLHWIGSVDAKAAGLALLWFVAPLQFLSAIYGFLARDSVAGTGMAILAGTWATVGVNLHAHGMTPSPTSGVVLAVAAMAITVPLAASVPKKLVAGAVLLTTAVRFALTSVWEFHPAASVRTAAGVCGIVLAALAWYAALALEIEDSRRKTVLPTFRHGGGQLATRENIAEEVDLVAYEAGVREQL
jgi:succinate-acetate transporter protein